MALTLWQDEIYRIYLCGQIDCPLPGDEIRNSFRRILFDRTLNQHLHRFLWRSASEVSIRMVMGFFRPLEKMEGQKMEGQVLQYHISKQRPETKMK